jgi:hypothetical protein
MMRGMTGELGKFVAEFRRSEALAPPGKEALLQHVTAHEQALLATFGSVRERVRISRKEACLRRSECAGLRA